jgi:hypothetical protein
VSKFKPRPELRALPDPEAVAAFAAGAEHRATTPLVVATPSATSTPLVPTPIVPTPLVPAPSVAVKAPPTADAVNAPTTASLPVDAAVTNTRRRRTSDEVPWEKYDRDARPLSGINVRLNDYEHELLKYLADADDRSLQQTIKRLLIPAAEAAARKVRRAE